MADWYPAVPVGRLAAAISDANQRKLNCPEKLKSIVRNMGIDHPYCKCKAGEMETRSGYCEKASVATFRTRISGLCRRNFETDDERFAASLVLLKVGFNTFKHSWT